ncbi:MAG TPA: glycine--tRNA ligase subunit beta [Actinobacteria bacterium]|nr:glycine--tRNA ligase subunit beta [Actinomycetota bacterium]
METKNLLFEIGTEELPSSCINEGILSLEKNTIEKFSKNRIDFKNIKTYGTPRRLVALVEGLNVFQSPSEKMVMGPPRKIAFDSDGNPNQAAIGFAKSLNIKIEDLEFTDTERGQYLCKKIFEKEEETNKILPGLLADILNSITFSVQMTWADWQVKFARPIRWILAVFGEDIIKVRIESIESSDFTFGHRTLSAGKLKVKNADNYIDFLENNGSVILDKEKRRGIILGKIRKIENENEKKLKVIVNEELLDEIVNLVEIPNVLLGSFPESFLVLPDEILIKAIEYHQRYFAVKSIDGKIIPKFAVVQNGTEDRDNSIIKGNERVLKARLSDASFFYSEDRKLSWENWVEKLKGVIFYSGLGTIFDKQQRLEKICTCILNELKQHSFNVDKKLEADCIRASHLCKTDLVTKLVVEFPELQGVVGREYARERKEETEVSEAIFEHYLPRFYGDILPQTLTGTVLSLADKLDTITGMFLAGNIPSGSEDPFALRRRATGIVQSLTDRNLDIDLGNIIDFCISLYSVFDICIKQDSERKSEEIFSFIAARLKFLYEKEQKRSDIIDAIIGSGCRSVKEITKRYDAIEKIILEGLFEDIVTPMIRCKNITKNKQFYDIKEELLAEKSEKSLYEEFIEKRDKIKNNNLSGRYEESVREIIRFRKTIDRFFDEVLVMDKDESVRNNRISLVGKILELYLDIADFSVITI